MLAGETKSGVSHLFLGVGSRQNTASHVRRPVRRLTLEDGHRLADESRWCSRQTMPEDLWDGTTHLRYAYIAADL